MNMQHILTQIAPWIVAVLGTGGVIGLIKVLFDYLHKRRTQTDDMATRVVDVTNARLSVVERHSIICEARA